MCCVIDVLCCVIDVLCCVIDVLCCAIANSHKYMQHMECYRSLLPHSGHYLDQKRLKQGLYRHPWDDIAYIAPEELLS